MSRSVQSPRASLRIFAADALFVAFILFSYPLALAMPESWGLENGVIENLQVVALLCGGAAAFLVWSRNRGTPLGALGASTVPIWLILAARELSWGAVVTQADAVRAGLPLHPMWYKPAVAPVICALLAWSALTIWRHRLGRFLLALVRHGHYALVPLGLAVVASYFSACAEGHAFCGIHADPHHAQDWEEGLELIAYSALVFAQRRVFRAYRPVEAVVSSAVVPEHEAFRP
nr:hypothetical protein [uncultured Massilia sp.]